MSGVDDLLARAARAGRLAARVDPADRTPRGHATSPAPWLAAAGLPVAPLPIG